MVFDREEAARRAEASTTNVPGTCQNWTWNIFGAHAVGDVDSDKDADAVDGWESEPKSAQHPGDRNPPRGVPVAWSGGSHGFGHRAVSLGRGKIRSTDAGGSGVVATVDLDWPEKNWGLHYLGWSETISGETIPLPGPMTRGQRIDNMLRIGRLARKQSQSGHRDKIISAALRKLRQITPHR